MAKLAGLYSICSDCKEFPVEDGYRWIRACKKCRNRNSGVPFWVGVKESAEPQRENAAGFGLRMGTDQ